MSKEYAELRETFPVLPYRTFSAILHEFLPRSHAGNVVKQRGVVMELERGI